MPDNLAIITDVILQHSLIRHQIELVGSAVSDMDALFGFQQAHAVWAQSSIEVLSEKQKQLEQVTKRLDEGLKKHFDFEEKALPPIFGEILMKALVLEHRNTLKELERARATLASKMEGLTQEELLSRKAQLQQMIGNICQIVEEHASHEELILRMIKRALEAEA